LESFGLTPTEFGELEEHEQLYMKSAVAERVERENEAMPDT
jgi:hypothetical protein